MVTRTNDEKEETKEVCLIASFSKAIVFTRVVVVVCGIV